MNRRPNRPFARHKRALLACAALLGLAAPIAASAQDMAPVAPRQVDPNRLLELMVQRGLVSRADADALIAEASTAPASAPAPIQGGVSGDVQTVPYVPQVVRNQIRDEIRTEVMAQAQREGWAAPDQVAEWTRRITLYGDVRVRGEGVFMDEGNFDLAFPNFATINAGPGYDISPSNPEAAPFLNSTEDRFRARIRARLGLRARIDDWITAEVRLATGADASPVTANQTLGANGELGKYAAWIDRANLQFSYGPLRLDVGRADNPFWTSELLFDEDLGFDGASLRLTAPIAPGFALFGSVGAFAIFNTDFNFGSNEAGAFASRDRYLAAGQAGLAITDEDVNFRIAAGYFHFGNVQGELSSPCFFDQDVCDTDATRPQFLQFGNSLFPIRNIVPDPNDPVGSPQVQYFGLASRFEVVNAHAQLDLTMFDPVRIRLEGDLVKNLAFDRDAVAARAINNLGPAIEIPDPDDPDETIIVPGPWDGGDLGWYANLTVGRPDLAEPGDWRFSIGYRRLESDAVLDAFADSDFHLGGTNARGFILGGGYAFGRNTALLARWLSADSITGIPYSNDVVQIDLVTRF